MAEELKPWLMDEATWRGKVAHASAGRSLRPTAWPNGAKFAVALSFDSDHETFELRNGGNSYGRLSQGQYGSRVGSPRILRILAKHNVPATFYMPAVAAMLTPDEPRAVVDSGSEIGIHSWIHEFNSRLDFDTERDLAMRARDMLTKLSGVQPVGMRTASWDFSPYTLKIIREMGLLYDSSLMADDDAYELLDEGQPTGVVEIPVEWIRDDAVYYAMDRMQGLRPYGGPEMVYNIFKRELDAAAAEGGVFQVTMHPHHSGHRSRIWVLESIIQAAKDIGGAWFATHADIARHCLAHAAPV
jgi:peptidoglycan/xylan/chitin deacetylase (PgdA/CDA1 family)